MRLEIRIGLRLYPTVVLHHGSILCLKQPPQRGVWWGGALGVIAP